MSYQFKVCKKKHLTDDLLEHFIRHEEVTDIRENTGEGWKNITADYTRDWNEQQKKDQIENLRITLEKGGYVCLVQDGENIAAFAAVERKKCGSGGIYRKISALYVSEPYRRKKLATGLLEYLVYFMGQAGGQGLLIETEAAGPIISFLEKVGFTVDGGEIETSAEKPVPTAVLSFVPENKGVKYTPAFMIMGLFLGFVAGQFLFHSGTIGMLLGMIAGVGVGVYLDTRKTTAEK